ncbi:porin [Paraburkholderia azotifigens]|uniref:porin n=1 Tax=Paraburkholderia azotifigens TaxID=2057004 RepID=UPI00048F554C
MRLIWQGMCGATMVLATGCATAQSSVTLYGVVDVFVQYLDNGGKHSFSERSGGNTGSMFGLRGREDLGDGLKAIFDVENGFNVNNGSFFVDSSALFYRQAWVGLSHDRYGSLTFGRQYQPTFWALYPSDPFRADEVLSPLAAMALAQGTDRNTIASQYQPGRVSNSMVYTSPSVGGFKFYGMYGFAASSTQPVVATTGNFLDVAATYTGYGFYAGIGYSNQHSGTEVVPGLPVPLGLLGAEHFTAALAYRIGIVNLQANYSYNRSKDPAAHSLAAILGAAHSYSIAEAGATIQVSAADTIEIAGVERNVRGVHDNAVGVELGADHSLSKRTALYARVGYLKNNGSSSTSWPGIAAVPPGSKQVLAVLGMTHRF